MSTIDNLTRVYEERASDWQNTGKPLADIAAERELTADETATWERANSAFDAMSSRIKGLELAVEQERQLNAFRANLEDTAVAGTDNIGTELRSVLMGEKSAHDFNFTGAEMTRALNVATATAGGNTVPATFLNQLMSPLRNFVSVLDAGATIITTTSGESLTIPRISAFGASAQVAEATALNGTDPAFDQLTLKAYKFGDYRLLSRELVEDAAIDIESLVTGLIGQNIGLMLGQRLTTGTGTNQTAGLFTAATVGVTGATAVAGVPSLDNVIDLFYSVAAPYRANGKFIISDAALGGLRKLKDSTGGYLWSPSVQSGQPDLILGKAVFADPNVAAPAVGARSMAFGDMSAYWVRFVNSVKIERSDQAAFSTDQIAFRGVLRADGLLTDASAVKVFVGAAS
jgi:HK97 family phage major capsid protein